MRSFFLGVFSALAIPIAVAVLVLLSVPSLRHVSFRMAAEMPGIVYFYLIRRQILSSNFQQANTLLNRQLDMVDDFAPSPNTLLPGLIRNATFAAEQAKLRTSIAALRPFFEHLVKSEPKLLRARLWLARALKDKNQAQALKHLEVAARLVPSDERSYRLAIEIAARERDGRVLSDWCSRFQTDQLGGTNPYWSMPMLQGAGLRRLGLEFVDMEGGSQLVVNSGLQLGKMRTYGFQLGKPIAIADLTLHLGVVPGIRISVGELSLLHMGRKRVIKRDNLLITTQNGFILGNGDVLSVSRNGESITFIPPEGGFGKADRVQVNLGFKRMAVAVPAVCGGTKK